MLKAIVMDFDGLIIDTEVVWYQLYKKWFLKEYNYALSIEKFLVCVGADSNYLFDELKQQEGIHVDAPKLNAILGKQFIESSRNLPAKPGVERLIKKAKQNKLQLILATSASRKKPMYHLQRLGLLSYFDCILTSENVEKVKPNPELFQLALTTCNIKANEALVFEDSLNGVLAANRADISVVVCPNNITQYSTFTKYYQKVTSLEEVDLQNIIKNFQQGAISHDKDQA